MDNKMRVGRKQADGTWSGAIGNYFEYLQRKARQKNLGRERNRVSGEPGANTVAIRERTLRVLSRMAYERGIEWMHEAKAELWADAVEAAVAEARINRRTRNGEVKPNTIGTFKTSMRAFAIHCGKRGAISSKRLDEILDLIVTEPRAQERYLMLPQARWPEIFARARARHPVELAFFGIALFAGLRSSEIRRLRWGNVLWDGEPRLEFHRDKRSGLSHNVPMKKELQTILLEWQAWLKRKRGVDSIPPEWHVISPRVSVSKVARKDGVNPDWPVDPAKAIHKDTATKWAKDAVRALGYSDDQMRDQACHIFRRSGGEAVYQKSKDVRKTAIWFGHGTPEKPNVETSMIYLGQADVTEDLRATLDSIIVDIGLPALPAGGSVIVPGPDDILPPSKAPAEFVSKTLEELVAEISASAMWDELVRRYEPEEILCEAVERTASLSREEQLLHVKAFRISYDRAVERAKERRMIAT